jgi:hypothetical protein
MSDFFGGLRSGIQFPQVVMNQGPLPGSGGLPQPLHETPDARINYNSTLLGDLTPYAYGEPGYLSSQNAYLNIPHKIQKIVPVVYLPEAKRPATEVFDLSHPIDDGDLAFVLRLDRSSMFCTGLKNGSMKRAGLGTAIDPFINLCTLNYILSGVQLGMDNSPSNLWRELLQNLDKNRFGGTGENQRNYADDPVNLNDLIHIVRHCIRPFGVTRGSEKQGGQDEATISPATWPVSFVVSLTVDGKESNVLNIWHHQEMHAGDDLVLRFKPMPLRPYTLNHYYKGVKRQTWDNAPRNKLVWQLVPDLMSLEAPKPNHAMDQAFEAMDYEFRRIANLNPTGIPNQLRCSTFIWQEMGYWHIGRSQIQTGKYGTEEYWHNDLANNLRTNHLDITFQPMFQALPMVQQANPAFEIVVVAARAAPQVPLWEPRLSLEQLSFPEPAASYEESVLQTDIEAEAGAVEMEETLPATMAEPQEAQAEPEPDWLGRLEFSDEAAEPPAATKKRPAKRRTIGGSLLRADGTSEPSTVGML